MDKTRIYYFSGTGNTLYLAREASARLGAELIPIAAAARQDVIRPGADVVGIFYPVYYNDLPMIVRDFADRLRCQENTYVFAVCNYGGCGGRSVKTLSERIRAAGGALDAAYGIHMPQNAFPKPWERNDKLIEKGGARARKIAEDVQARKKGIFLRGPLNALFLRLHPSLLPRIRADLAKKTGLSPETPLDVLVRSVDGSYTSGDRCTGCGICEKVCPVNNLVLDGGRPRWLGHCENCLACYNWCPVKAIRSPTPRAGYYYRNARIEAPDIMAQRQNA